MRVALVLALAALASGCGERATSLPADAAATVRPIELRAADGTLRARITGDVLVGGGERLTLSRQGDALTVTDDAGQLQARLRPGPAGHQLSDAAGQPVFRVVEPGGGAFDLVGPDGIALLRTRPDPDAPGAIGRDAGGQPVVSARPDSGLLVVSARDGTRLATVHNSQDAQLALVLSHEKLPLAQRFAVLALRRSSP